MEVKNDFDLKRILDNFKNIKIGVVGDLMLDDYISVSYTHLDVYKRQYQLLFQGLYLKD